MQCRRCQGGTVMCSSCLGSGQKTETRQGAGGRSYQQSSPCSWCGGSGRRPCDTCRGNGWLICADCDGSSQVIQFTCATIRNRPDTVTVSTRSAAPSEIKFKKVDPEEWTRVSLSDGSSVPEGLPSELSSELEAALKDVEPGERLRKLEVNVLPVTTVTPEGTTGTRAHVIGEGGKVFTRKTVSMKRVLLTGLLLALLIIGLLVAIQSRAPADGTPGTGSGAAAFSPEELEAEISTRVEFQTGERIDPEDVSCEPESSTPGRSTASCSVIRSDGLVLPLIVSFTEGRILIDVDPSFSGVDPDTGREFPSE